MKTTKRTGMPACLIAYAAQVHLSLSTPLGPAAVSGKSEVMEPNYFLLACGKKEEIPKAGSDLFSLNVTDLENIFTGRGQPVAIASADFVKRTVIPLNCALSLENKEADPAQGLVKRSPFVPGMEHACHLASAGRVDCCGMNEPKKMKLRARTYGEKKEYASLPKEAREALIAAMFAEMAVTTPHRVSAQALQMALLTAYPLVTCSGTTSTMVK